MKPRTRFNLEQLEDRWCPALTTSLQAGTLVISGTAANGTIHINQDATTAGTLNVLDGTTAVNTTPFTGVNNVRLNLTSADDTVAVDLGGQDLAGILTANLGAGANSLTVANGNIDGSLNVSGAAANSLRGRGGECGGHHGFNDTTSGTSTTNDVTTTLALVLAANASANNVNVGGAAGGTNVTIAGDVTGNLNVDAFSRSSSTSTSTTATGATLTVSGGVDGNVRFRGTNLADTFTVTGDLGGSVSADTLGGADTVSIGGAVTGRLSLDTGTGNDSITLSNTVGGRTQINAGAGNDSLALTSTANLLGRATVSMGTGNDAVTLDDAALFSNLFISGGSGTDTFTGTQRTGLTLSSF